MAQKKSKSKYIFLILRIAVITAGLVWAVSRMGQEQRWQSCLGYFKQINILILIGMLVCFMAGHVIVSLRWWLLLRNQSIFITLGSAIKLYFLGWFYNNFMPSSVGGDLVRAWYVTKHTEKSFEAVLSVFVDRVIGMVSTLGIAAFFYVLFLRGEGSVISTSSDEDGGFLNLIVEYIWVFYWLFGLLAVFAGVLLLLRSGRRFLVKSWSAVIAHSTRMIRKLTSAVVIYFTKPMAILAAFLLTIFLQIMIITCFWVLGVDMGIDVSIKYYYVFFTLTWVIGTVPISIGGAVVVEGALVILFTKFAGVDEAAAWAIALSQRAIWMITSLPGAAIHLFGAHLPKDFSVDYDEPVN